jgi:hypothetical protein
MANKMFKKIFRQVGKETKGFAEQFVNAARIGAEVSGRQILEATNNLNQPSDVLINKVIDALKVGVRHAGQHVLTAGLDLVRGVGSLDGSADPSKSAGSAHTVPNTEPFREEAAANFSTNPQPAETEPASEAKPVSETAEDDTHPDGSNRA